MLVMFRPSAVRPPSAKSRHCTTSTVATQSAPTHGPDQHRGERAAEQVAGDAGQHLEVEHLHGEDERRDQAGHRGEPVVEVAPAPRRRRRRARARRRRAKAAETGPSTIPFAMCIATLSTAYLPLPPVAAASAAGPAYFAMATLANSLQQRRVATVGCGYDRTRLDRRATRRPTSPCRPTPARRCASPTCAASKVVLYAYPAAMTPGCTTQACDFRDSLASLQAAGLRGRRHLARQAGEAGEVPRARRAHLPAGLRRGQVGADRVRGVRREAELRQDGHRRHPLDVRHRRRRAGSSSAFYNVKATGHVAKLRQDLGLD